MNVLLKYKKIVNKITVFKSIRKVLLLIFQFDKTYIVITFVYQILQGITPMIFIVMMQQIINLVQCKNYSFTTIERYIICFIIFHIVNELFEQLYLIYHYNFHANFSKFVNIKMMNKAISLSLSEFEDAKTYDIINRAQIQSGSTILNFVDYMFNIVKQIFSVISLLFILLRFKWQISLIILIIPICRCIVSYIIDKKRYIMRRARTKKERQNWYINYLIMTGHCFKEIKIYGIGKFLIKKYEKIQNILIMQDIKIYKYGVKSNTIFNVIDWMILGFIYIYTLSLGYYGIILIGDVTAYLESVNNIKKSIEGIFAEINNMLEHSMYIQMFFEYFNLPEKMIQKSNEIKQIRQIEFRNVSFKYNDNKEILKNINLKIKSSDIICIIGENGSGKTTLSKLLLGLYEKYEGEIFINNINFKSISQSSYYKRIGCVFQDFVKYETTLRENIAYGDIKKIDDNENILRVIREVNLEKVLNDNKTIDMVVGSWFGEVQLSIGEWQRIAIARALIKEADVFLFDEPDASLDLYKQRELIYQFKKIVHNKIGIYISHRIDHIKELGGVIIVMKEGEIIEIGNHTELMKKRGYYYQMYVEANKEKIT